MKSFQNIISLNTAEQNGLMAWYCLQNSEIGRFKQLLSGGMELSAFMLNAMVFFGYSDQQLKEVLQIANKRADNVVTWMSSYFEVDELAEVLPLYEDMFSDIYPKDEDCIRLKLWKTLRKRNRVHLIAKFAPEVAEQMNLYNDLLKADFAKYAPICLQNNYLFHFLEVDDGWKYLVDNGKAGWVLERGTYFDMLPREEVVEYCLQKGLYEELYAAECYEQLLAAGVLDIFVKKHSTYGKFLLEHPEMVEWEVLWQEHQENELVCEYLKRKAKANKQVPQCNEFLLGHAGIFEQIMLFLR